VGTAHPADSVCAGLYLLESLSQFLWAILGESLLAFWGQISRIGTDEQAVGSLKQRGSGVARAIGKAAIRFGPVSVPDRGKKNARGKENATMAPATRKALIAGVLGILFLSAGQRGHEDHDFDADYPPGTGEGPGACR
jgi:hypothetical protein